MSQICWDKVEYFNINENWGDPSKINYELIYKLDFFREKLGCSIKVLCAYKTSGHSEKSQHYLGNAVDLRPSRSNLLDLYILADRVGFNGIGLYPNNGDWFIHLDVRPLKILYKNRWIRTDDGEYVSLKATSLIKYIIPIIK